MKYTNASMFIVGMNYAMPYIGQLTTMVYFGKQLDKSSTWRGYHGLTIIGYAAMTVQFVLFYVMSTGNPDAILFLIVSVICNLFATAYMPAIKKFASVISATGKQGTALSRVGIVESVSFASGCLVGIPLIGLAGINVLFFIAGIASICGICLLLVTRPYRLVAEMPPAILIHEHSGASNDITVIQKKEPRIFFHFKEIFVLLVALNVSIGLFFPFFSPYMESLHADVALIGASQAAASILGALLYKVFGFLLDKNHPHFTLLYGPLGYIVVFVIFLFTVDPVVAFISWAIPVYPYFLGANYIVAKTTPIERQGKGFSTASLAQTLGITIGSVAGGVLLSLPAFTFTSIILLVLIGLAASFGIFARAWVSRNARFRESEQEKVQSE